MSVQNRSSKKTGVLDLLLQKGYKYIFISNSDNLGAVVDSRILEKMAKPEIVFKLDGNRLKPTKRHLQRPEIIFM